MTTILQARPRSFVTTPAVERVVTRALRYLQSNFSVHLRGPAGTGKTTLALHLADLLGRPIMLVFGDDEFKTSDLIGNQSGYTRKKVVDNFIHSVVKVEDELKQNWVDSRLTLACREGFTLVYDEFNRSRPEVNNVLLSALEEKLLVLPPSGNRSEYIRVHSQFRAILTSNPEEYCGVHDTQDALMDRLITMNMPEPDELTQQEILAQKVGLNREDALLVVRLVKSFRIKTRSDKASGLRSCLMIAKVCHEHQIPIRTEDWNFRDICSDVLLSRVGLSLEDSTKLLWEVFSELAYAGREPIELTSAVTTPDAESLEDVETDTVITAELGESDGSTVDGVLTDSQDAFETDLVEPEALEALTAAEAGLIEPEAISPLLSEVTEAGIVETPTIEAPEAPELEPPAYEQKIFAYLQQVKEGARVSEIETALGINRFQAVNALRSLAEKGILMQRKDRVYIAE